MLASSAVQRTLLLVLVLLLAAIGVVLVVGDGRGSGSSGVPGASTGNGAFRGPTLPANLVAADFSLRDQNGRLVALHNYRGQVVILTFIHSKCHDACPLMVEDIKGALDLLPGGGRGVPAIGVSVAPAEDTPASRHHFLREWGMDARLAFVGGTTAQLRPVWHDYAMQPVAKGIDHSTFVLLIDRRGHERIGYAADQLRPEDLAHDIRALEREPA